MATITWILISAFVLFALGVMFYPSKQKKKSKKKSKTLDAEVVKMGMIKRFENIHPSSFPRISSLIGGFVVLLVGFSLLPTIANQISSAASSAYNQTYTASEKFSDTSSKVQDVQQPQQTNATGTWGSTVLKLIPGFFALGILGLGIIVVYSMLRNNGMIGGL